MMKHKEIRKVNTGQDGIHQATPSPIPISSFDDVKEIIRQNVRTQSSMEARLRGGSGQQELFDMFTDVFAYTRRQNLTFPSDNPLSFKDRMLVGDLNIDLLRYSGESLRFTRGVEGVHTFEKGEVIGYIVHKPTGLVSDIQAAAVADAISHAGSPIKPKAMERIHTCVVDNGFPPRFETFLDKEQTPPGDRKVGFLVFAHINPAVRGLGLVDNLTSTALREVHDILGLKHAFTYGRLEGLSQRYSTADEARIHLHEEVARRLPDGRSPYSTEEFHRRFGVAACGMPDCAEDGKSLNHGFLAFYARK